MRTLACLALAGLTLTVTSCSRVLDFDISEPIPSQTVPGSPLGGVLPAGLISFPLDVNLQAEEQAHGTGPASTVTLSSMTLTITAPPGQTWDFLSSVAVDVSSTRSGSTLPKVEIAHLSPVPRGQTTISIPPDPGVDLIPYINEGADISASASGQQPTQNTTFDGQATVHVHF